MWVHRAQGVGLIGRTINLISFDNIWFSDEHVTQLCGSRSKSAGCGLETGSEEHI